MEAYTILLRADSAADWTAANPTLANGELAIELDTSKFKFGDGSTAWTDLDYVSAEAVVAALADIGDVTITTPADNEVLAYDNASSEWINQTAAEAALATSTHDHDGDYDALGAATTVQGNLDDHEGDTANPHTVTAAQADALPEDAVINAVSATYTVLASDAGKVIEANGTFTITLPNGLDAGFQCSIVNVGAGTITLAATTTLQSSGAAVTLATQYEGCVVYHRGSNVWLAMGGLE